MTKEELEKRYMQLAAKVGDLKYRMYLDQGEIDSALQEMKNINVQGAQLLKAGAVAEEGEVLQ